MENTKNNKEEISQNSHPQSIILTAYYYDVLSLYLTTTALAAHYELLHDTPPAPQKEIIEKMFCKTFGDNVMCAIKQHFI